MVRSEDEDKGWYLIGDLDNLKGKVICFKAEDLKDFFDNFDRWWLQIKRNTACISHEGFSYEPYYIGQIREVKKNEEKITTKRLKGERDGKKQL